MRVRKEYGEMVKDGKRVMMGFGGGDGMYFLSVLRKKKIKGKKYVKE